MMNFNKLFFLSFFMAMVLMFAGTVHAHERIRDYSTFNPSHDFTLTDQNGNPFHLKDHRGKIILLFFGYLSCPDVCPITLSKLSRVYSELKENEADQILTAFVSVDPERDSIENIKEYLDYFDIKAVGLTGTKQEIDSVVNAYKGSYEKVRVTSALGYLIDHISYLYLIAPDGGVKYLFRPEDDVEHMIKIIQEILRDFKK